MNIYRILVLFSFISISETAWSQRFENKIEISKVYYEPSGTHAFLITEGTSVSIYKWNIGKSIIEGKWQMDFNKARIYFVDDIIYVNAQIIESYSVVEEVLFKLNKMTNKLEHHNSWADKLNRLELLSVDRSGRMLLFRSEDLIYGTHNTLGPLYLKDPNKETKTPIETIIAGSVFWSKPTFQPTIKDKIMYMDYSKYDLKKRKLMLYDKNTSKVTTLAKKVQYGNYVLTGYEDLFVFQYHDKDDKSSDFTFYNESGDQIVYFDWYTYAGMMFDYTHRELYMLKNNKSAIDVFSTPSMKKIRTIPAIEDFYIRDDAFAARDITNRKLHRLILETSGDLTELIGYFEALNFETGKYERIGKPLREGYTFDQYEEVKEMTQQMDKEAAKKAAVTQLVQFKADIAVIPDLVTSGNRTTLEAMDMDSKAGKTWDVAHVGSYNQLATNVGKVCETDRTVAVLVRSTEGDNEIKGDFLEYVDFTNFYLSIVNIDMKYEAIKTIGKDVKKAKQDKYTGKFVASGLVGSPTSISWSNDANTFWVTGNSGTYTIDKATCTIK